jgi:protein-S-isoprenylcysteine O-methyltransferase Ste14
MQGPKLYVLTAFQLAAMGVLVWVLVSGRTPWNAQRYAGTVLVILGAMFIAVARYQLGKSFAVAPKAHTLVTHGLYSKIRNPIYVFDGVLLVGLFLILQKPLLWILLAIVIFGQAIRARKETKVLEAAFGDDYREYRRKTWF